MKSIPEVCRKCNKPVCGSFCQYYPGRIAVLAGYPAKAGLSTQRGETPQQSPSNTMEG